MSVNRVLVGDTVWDLKPGPHEEGRTYLVLRICGDFATCRTIGRKVRQVQKDINFNQLCLAVERSVTN